MYIRRILCFASLLAVLAGSVNAQWTVVNLKPAGSTESSAWGASGANQVGWATVGGVDHASLWSGTAASWVDLHDMLPAGFSFSHARSVTTDGIYNYIVGYGVSNVTNHWEALLWISPVVGVVLPDSFSMFRGFLTSGGLSDLFESDDQKLLVRAGLTLFAGESPLQVIVTGTSPVAVPSELRFTLEASVSTPGLMQTLFMFNYVTGLYEEVDFWAGTPSDLIVEVVVSTNPERFVQAGTGEMKAKISYTQVGLTLQWPWSARLDQTIWRVIP